MALLRRLAFLLVLLLGLPARAADLVADDAPPLAVVAPELPEGWDAVRGPFLVVHGDPDRRPVLRHLARHGARSLPRLADELGVPLGTTVHVAVAGDRAEFEALQPGRPPEWADATAWPGAGWVFLRAPRARGPEARPLEQVLDHELVHVLLGRAFAPHRAPRWLDEGLARVYAGEHGPDGTRELARGLARSEPFTLVELSLAFPRDPQGASLAYAQSADLVAFVRARHGDEAVRALVRELAGGAGVEAAARAATGLYVEDLEAAWLRQVRGPLACSGMAAEDAVWFVIGVLGVVALVVARRRLRVKRARAVEEDRLLEAMGARPPPPGVRRDLAGLDGYRWTRGSR